MTFRSRLLPCCAVIWAATGALPAWAQTVTEPVIVVTDPNAGRFAALPAGERKIAQSLYDAQTGTTVMSRDDIAAARGTQGWGQVFRGMQADGLVQQRNLGQVVSGGHHAAAVAPAPVTVSYGNGGTTTGSGGVSTGHRHTVTGVTTASGGGGGAGIVATHGNSHGGHAAAIAASTPTNAGGGTAGGHGKGKH